MNSTQTQTQYGTLESTFSVRGMEIERYIDPMLGKEIWKPRIRHPFMQADHKLRASLNDKLLETAYEKGITGILVGGRVMPREMYSPQALKKKIKAGECETKQSYFGEANNYVLFYFFL